MLKQCYHWLKGYLKIRLVGYSPERFINLCKNKNIIIWDLKSFEDYYEMHILMNDFKKLRPLSKKTVTKIKILEKKGFPFTAHKFKKHKAFIIGLCFFLFLIYFSSFYIWEIDIKGNKKLTSDVICSYLREQSIKPGTLIKYVDCKELTSDLRNNFEDIIWVSTSLDGTKLCIEIKENMESISMVEKESSPTDLIAAFDGNITHIITRNGVPMVKVGDTVKKGDILVSGSIPVMNDNKEIASTKYVKADADIWGEIRINYQDKIDAVYQKKKYTLNSIYLEIGPLKTPLKSKENTELFIENNWIKIGKINKYELINSCYTLLERESILENRYNKYVEELVANHAKIIESDFIITHSENHSIAVSSIVLEQPIDESRKIIDLSPENMLQ